MKVSQDMRILQQFLKDVGERGDGATVNIISIENNYNCDSNPEDDSEIKSPKSRCAIPKPEISSKQIQHFNSDNYEIVYDFINKFPTPRLDTLLCSIFKMCVEKEMTRQETADFLGMAYATASSWFKRFNLKPPRPNKGNAK